MLVYTNVRLLACEEKSFADPQKPSESIVYNECYIKDVKSGDVMRVSSGKQNFDQMEGEVGAATFEVKYAKDKDGIERLKMKLTAFNNDAEVQEPEKTVE